MRPTAVFRHGEWIPTDVMTPNGYPTRPEPPPVQRHISDSMSQHLLHMGTGEMIDSKSRFREATRRSGCVEVGNDPAITRNAPTPEPTGVREDVARAFSEVKLITPGA